MAAIGVAVAGLAGAAVLAQRDARRAERASPPTGGFLVEDGVRLHYIDTGGTDRPVVLLHGNGGMIADMEIAGLVEQAARRHRVYVFDRPGFGYSTRPRGRAWTPEAQAALFARVFARLGIEAPIVIGHSWGALLALALALEHPQAVGGLVLVSGYYFPTPRPDAAMLVPPAIPVLGDLLCSTVAPLVGRVAAPFSVRRMFAPRHITQRFAAEFPLALALRPRALRALSEETAMLRPAAARLQDRYRQLGRPVTILAGSDDRIVGTEAQSVRLHREVLHSELRVIPGQGHMLHHFAADEIVDAVDAVAARMP